MGRPNSAKLANFPECEVFVYVSCAQTALLDSKDFLAPVITPFEAVLAFSRYATLTYSTSTIALILSLMALLQIYVNCQMWHQFAELYYGSDVRSKFFQGKRVDWRISYGFQGFDHFGETGSYKCV